MSKTQPRYSRDYFDAQKAFTRSRPASEDVENARNAAAALSAPLSLLLIPSLKEVSASSLQNNLEQEWITIIFQLGQEVN